MMDELKQQFYEVMHKYQKPFSEEGVTANLTQWYEQKQGLLQLLRRHPLWNEKRVHFQMRPKRKSLKSFWSQPITKAATQGSSEERIPLPFPLWIRFCLIAKHCIRSLSVMEP